MAVVKNAKLTAQEVWNGAYDSTNEVIRAHSGSGDGANSTRSVQTILNLVYDSVNKRLKVR